jgi:hypothetical protein
MSAASVSLTDRRLPWVWGMDRGDGRLVGRVVPKKRRRSASVHLAQSRSCQLTGSSIGLLGACAHANLRQLGPMFELLELSPSRDPHRHQLGSAPQSCWDQDLSN